jgi:hypothetical protein
MTALCKGFPAFEISDSDFFFSASSCVDLNTGSCNDFASNALLPIRRLAGSDRFTSFDPDKQCVTVRQMPYAASVAARAERGQNRTVEKVLVIGNLTAGTWVTTILVYSIRASEAVRE